MRLHKLLQALPDAVVKGSKELEITGLSEHSKAVGPGYLFIARQGTREHGIRYLSEALRGGAVAVLTDLFDPSLRQITQIIVRNVESAEAHLAAAFFGNPSHALTVFGVTGTNGKTTVTHFIQQLWHGVHGTHCGLVGSLGHDVGGGKLPATVTTPDVLTVHKLLREMVGRRCGACAIEVTSHALDQGRIASVHVDVAVFTNLTQDHLDYHGTMERYAAAKARLFTPGAGGQQGPLHTVAWGDDPWLEHVLAGSSQPPLLYGMQPACALQLRSATLREDGMEATICWEGREVVLHLRLLGMYNLLNVLGAMGALLVTGTPLDALLPHVEQLRTPPGRLERISTGRGPQVFVDFAHTPGALSQVAGVLQPMFPGKLCVVFGAGGDRDGSKRPLMAAAVAQYADRATVTSDNPRKESPSQIAEEVAAGFPVGFPYKVVLDRTAAIEEAILSADPEGAVLIAGRGSDAWQVIADKRIPLHDPSIARAALAAREAGLLTEAR